MKFQSSRGGEKGCTFEKVLLSAYAVDGGMYVPEYLPCITKDELQSWQAHTFPQVCAEIVHRFSDIPLDECNAMTKAAFSTFNNGEDPPLPLKHFGDTIVLETGEGPTLAFKDIGQQVVAQLLNYFLGRRGTKANILVETSGDTGPAAVAAVKACPHVEIFCLYPSGRVSPVQELQLITVDSPNVHVYRSEGNTDEQADVLKEIFMDEAWVKKHNICSINSINWGRITAQSSYYIWSYLQMRPAVDSPVNFIIPTGALGNALGGFIAKKMGVPIGTIVCATNENDAVHRCISRGELSFAPNIETVSPAMDIQFAYNLERVLFYICNQNTEVVGRYMRALEADGSVKLDPLIVKRLRETFRSTSVSNADTLAAMKKMWVEHGYSVCPHGACAIHAQQTIAADLQPAICVLTAHPAKFEDTVMGALGEMPSSVTDNAAVIALKKLPRDKFTWLRKRGDGWRADWIATIKAAVEDRGAAAGGNSGAYSKM